MKIDLIFGSLQKTIYIPNFYTNNISQLRDDFLEWASNQSSCIIFNNKRMILSYNAEDFLEFINIEILKDQYHKAYFISDKNSKKNVAIKF